MAAARRSGRGVYEREWTYVSAAAPNVLDATRLDAMTESIIAWCRETLAAMRRPWGIDGFDLAVAVAVDGGAARSLSLRQLRPLDLYEAETPGRLRAFLHRDDAEQLPAVRRIAVAIFSWGDAAHEVLT